MACKECNRHSVICGACGKCLQEHCGCIDTNCLKCGSHLTQPLVDSGLGLRPSTRTCKCGGQLVANPRGKL